MSPLAIAFRDALEALDGTRLTAVALARMLGCTRASVYTDPGIATAERWAAHLAAQGIAVDGALTFGASGRTWKITARRS